ncbi:40S ribosomal protein S19 [Ananas comosus]|uniref:40S ribosomal protein S19 n=1 Tax=Ananas comosus TaxID=4615 RepID=A0A199VLR6_ANACO|nr:40S ribosomal protein S19 [Ananas comosus]
MEAARTVKDVSPHEFVKAYSAHLKRSGKMELPEWTDIVKTGRFKELAPYDPDWYYIRAASMARKIYLRQGIGVGGFQKIYGGRKRNGCRPPHFCKSSGAVARHILQQLQSMSIIDVDPKGACFTLPWNSFFSWEDDNFSGKARSRSGGRKDYGRTLS